MGLPTRYRHRAPFRILGQPYHGRVVTVGVSGFDYTSVATAMLNSPNESLILVFPGTYTSQSCQGISEKKRLFVRGMGKLTTETVIQFTGTSNYGWYPYDIGDYIFENFRMYSGQSYSFFSNNPYAQAQHIRLNRMYIEGGSTSLYYLGQWYSPYDGLKCKMFVTNSYLTANTHAIRINVADTEIYIQTTQLNKAWTQTQCNYSPVVNDSVTTDTPGYGCNQGSYLIEILDPAYLRAA